MKVVIEYCAQWNYRPRASRVEDELRGEAGIEVELVAGSGGLFLITVDGKEIFSKFKAKRFPEPGEIASLIKESRP